MAADELERLTDDELRGLISDLAEVDSQRAALDLERAALRERIGLAVAQRGGTFIVPGLATATFNSPGVTRRYLLKDVEAVAAELKAAGELAWAQRLLDARTEKERAGVLYITKAKL